MPRQPFYVDVTNALRRRIEDAVYPVGGRLPTETQLTEDLDGFAVGRLRVPVETLTYEATNLYVVPMLEIGATWSF